MAKWHNGPNGPGICRARTRACPFGGAESHFDSKEKAEKVYNDQNSSEFGVLPGMANDNKVVKEDKRETKVFSYNSGGVAVSNGNFVDSAGQGNDFADKYISNKLKQSDMDGNKMVGQLNADKKIYGKWSLVSESEDNVKLKNLDVFGNTSYLEVKKTEPKSNKPKRGDISSHSAGERIPMSLSNYVDQKNKNSSTEEDEQLFKDKIAKADYDSAKMVRYLNADKNITGKWALAREDDKSIRLKNTDVFGNENYVSVSKG